MKAGFWPDTFSTDWTPEARTAQVIDFPNVHVEVPGLRHAARSGDRARDRSIRRGCSSLFRDRGTLNVGAPADIAVLELRQGSFEFLDNFENKRTGRQRLFPSGLFSRGKPVSGARLTRRRRRCRTASNR